MMFQFFQKLRNYRKLKKEQTNNLKVCDSKNMKESLAESMTPDVMNKDIIGPHINMKTQSPIQFETTEQLNSVSVNNTTHRPEDSIHQVTIDNSTAKIAKEIAAQSIQILMVEEKKKMRQNNFRLKQIITKQKIKVNVQNFIKKLYRNNIYAKPVDFTPFFNQKERSFLDTQGIQLNDYLQTALFIFSIFLIIILCILSTLSLVFEQVQSSIVSKAFSSIGLIYFFFEMSLNLITIKFEEGKRLGTLRQIWNYCGRTTLVTDVITLIILFIDQFTDNSEITYMRIFISLKLGQAFEKIEKLQILFIHNFYYQQYWSLMKVFLFNFSLAHILAVCILAMAQVNTDDNWMAYKDIYLAPWNQKYAWAYYWATTIMLTVGFGDLNATNYKEAIILTLIEMISCIALAYNINCVGMLITNIRSQDLEKGKNFKVFYKLSKKNNLTEDLEWRINNYIEESSNIKKRFNYEEESLFVEKLPKGLKKEFLKESNKKIFHNLPFFKNLMQRTLLNFAQKIEIHVCHPEQIIQHIDDPHNLLILKGGEIGFTCKKPGCKYNSTVIDQLKIMNMANPILISLGFIRNPRLNYEIKSLAYSVLYFLENENLLNILKGSQMDYEMYCLLRDKSLNMPNDYELFVCEVCNQRHTKFDCPKLHFIPIKQHVTDRYIYQVKHDRNQCNTKFSRYSAIKLAALKIYMTNKKSHFKTSKTFNTKKGLNSTKSKGLRNQRRFQHIEDNNQNIISKEISQIKDFFSKNTAQLIKFQMTKAFQLGEGHDQVWNVDSDKMKNYKSYFQSDNSCYLIDKFCITKRANTFYSKRSLQTYRDSIDSSSKLIKSSKNCVPDKRIIKRQKFDISEASQILGFKNNEKKE